MRLPHAGGNQQFILLKQRRRFVCWAPTARDPLTSATCFGAGSLRDAYSPLAFRSGQFVWIKVVARSQAGGANGSTARRHIRTETDRARGRAERSSPFRREFQLGKIPLASRSRVAMIEQQSRCS